MNREEARRILLAIGQPPVIVLRALRAELNLSDVVLSGVVGRSAQTVRRWRRAEGSIDVPRQGRQRDRRSAGDRRDAPRGRLRRADDQAARLLSRNTGLGQDRPLDGLRAALGAFRRVEHVVECFVAGVAPEPGPALADAGRRGARAYDLARASGRA